MDQNGKWNQREIIYSTICSVPGRNSGCVCWFLYQGITQWHYIYLIVRFVQKQEKTAEFESVCDKAEIWGFLFLVWLHSCLFGTIRLSQTSCLKAWDTIERTTEGTQEDRINGRRGHLYFFKELDPGAHYTICVCLDWRMSCFQNYLPVTLFFFF